MNFLSFKISAVPLMIILLAFALISSGCSHENSPIAKNQPIPTSITAWRSVDFSDPINPYDSIGYYHNLGLEYILTNIGPQNAPGYQNLYLRSDTLAIHFADSIAGFSASSDSANLHFARFVVTHGDSLWTSIILSPMAQLLMNGIDSIIMDYDTSLTREVTVLRSIDTQALSLSSTGEKRLVLSTAAVARYSASYWRSSDSLLWYNRDSTFGVRPITYLRAMRLKNPTTESLKMNENSGCSMMGNKMSRKGDRMLADCGCGASCTCSGSNQCSNKTALGILATDSFSAAGASLTFIAATPTVLGYFGVVFGAGLLASAGAAFGN
jgi:hypothetical protein